MASRYVQISDADGILQIAIESLLDVLKIGKTSLMEELILEKLKSISDADERLIKLLENKVRERQFRVESKLVRQEAHHIYLLTNFQKKVFNMCWQNVTTVSIVKHIRTCMLLKEKVPKDILEDQENDWSKFEKVKSDDVEQIKEYCNFCKQKMIKEKMAYDGTENLPEFMQKAKQKMIEEGKIEIENLGKKELEKRVYENVEEEKI